MKPEAIGFFVTDEDKAIANKITDAIMDSCKVETRPLKDDKRRVLVGWWAIKTALEVTESHFEDYGLLLTVDGGGRND